MDSKFSIKSTSLKRSKSSSETNNNNKCQFKKFLSIKEEIK
jgi:hypothetical protein